MIVSVVSLKGGVGKTTTALHLAAYVAAKGDPVVLVDADPEGSALSWQRLARASQGPLPFEVVRGERASLARTIRAAAQGATVILDTPPNDREILRTAAYVSDHVLVPLKPTGLDVDRLMPTLELLADTAATRGDLDVALLFTHWDAREVLSQESTRALATYPMLETRVRDLARYKQAFGTRPRYLIEYAKVWKELLADQSLRKNTASRNVAE